jgi:hypothetical protein
MQNLLSKLGLHSRIEAVALAIREGVTPPEPELAASGSLV